ncbi:uncharacterized protein LOC131892315 [Tigriopus californicus]|uniref:uncharacterized protein LOC131892315 n=1 Tax=Tigriopus californicus TaxID=6832 RepID=UPI0027D9F9AD|nr:uncharacterized protein LOC131892315 [Tigriopus californicus]
MGLKSSPPKHLVGFKLQNPVPIHFWHCFIVVDMMEWILLVLMATKALPSLAMWTRYNIAPSSSCDLDWEPIDQSKMNRSNLLVIAGLCSIPENQPKYVGVKCNEAGSVCERISHPKSIARCLEKPRTDNFTIYLRSTVVINYQPELTVVELQHGKLFSASVPGVDPITIPVISKSSLQIQMGQALVVCLETALVCNIWHQSTNQWTSLPPMTTRHQEGTLSLLEGQPIAIGGRHSSTVDHGVVEILNMQSNQWEQGPTLNPARRSHSTVVVNQSTVVVVGGYSEQSATLNSVMILHSEDMNWRLLPNYPQPVYAAVCGLVEVNVIVCFGGSTQTSDSYALNLSQLHAGWKRAPQYDFHTSLVYGVILRLRQNLFCMSRMIAPAQSFAQVMKMDLTGSNPKWKVVEEFASGMFDFFGLYVTEGFTIKP